IAPHRWPPAGARGHIDQALDAYEAVHANLVVHDPRYPAPATLRALVRDGNLIDAGDRREPTPGSDLIARVLLDHEPGIVVAQAWGGLNTIARALMSIEERYAGTSEWPAVQERISRRTVLTAWGEQDDAFAEYIRPHWPDLEFRQVATAAWGYAARWVTPPESHAYLSAEWTRENVSSAGPVGAAYRVWGDGLQMAEGFDPEDYFGLRDMTDDELRERGYQVFFPVEPAGAWISEGDTSNYALHIDNGLRNFEHPTFGGWGGRQEPHATDQRYWVSAGFRGLDLSGPPVDWGDVARWLPAFQRDFAARLRWSVTPSYAGANHAPRVEVSTGLDVDAEPGEVVTIRWVASDPDGDPVSVRPWQYREAGTLDAEVDLTRTGEDSLEVRIPADATPGTTAHVILEATDEGEPPLTAYARIVLTVR
ncbi:DUF1593 domain-containing protein, partial [Demequina sp.]|uniref:DUF1593 domain-containing protein n=1 Tax=Demequina sp. TaxID=2050685 RepID=UPI0025E31EF4